MKKRNLNSLKLNKKSISNLSYHEIKGGKTGTNNLTACYTGCEATETCNTWFCSLFCHD